MSINLTHEVAELARRAIEMVSPAIGLRARDGAVRGQVAHISLRASVEKTVHPETPWVW
jgi:hypothetical protein